MMTLYRTELRQLWPLGLLVLMLELLHTALLAFTTRIDETEYAELCEVYCQPGVSSSAIFILALVAVWVGWSLFPKDSDDGTLAHLKTLSVSRPQIYFSKIFAGFSLVVGFYILGAAITFLLIHLNPQTIHGKYYAAMELQHILRFVAFSTIVLCHSVFLSTFRLIGLVLYGAYFAIVAYLETLFNGVGAWNLLNLLRVEYFGTELITDWTLYIWHGVVALIALWLGYLRWMKRESNESNSRFSVGSPWVSVPLVVLTFMGLIGVFILHSQQVANERNNNFDSLETEHFRFVYLKSTAPYAEELAKKADDILLSIADYLNTEPPPKIQTDLSANTSHVAGLAVHNRIRMRLLRYANDTENPFVLAHETVHIFQSHVSQRQLKKVDSTVNFFIEGMAQQVAYTVLPDEAQRTANWVVGALAASRHEIKFSDMVDAQSFGDTFDPELPYTLGDLWVNTMAEVCGDESLGKFLNIVGSDDAVLSLRGVAFWRQHLQRIPCELEDINYRFNQRIETITQSEIAQSIPSTKTVNLRTDSSDSDVFWLDVSVNNPFPVDGSGLPSDGKDYFLRIKSNTTLSRTIDDLIVGYPAPDQSPEVISFRLSRSEIDTHRFQYQIGYVGGYDYRSVFDKWQNAVVPLP